MHHFLYSKQDAYISNNQADSNKNFGIDEMLIIGANKSYSKVRLDEKSYTFVNEKTAGFPLENFTGTITGSFFGTASDSSGHIFYGETKFTSSNFNGYVSGSINDYSVITSSYYFEGNLTNFSGSIHSIEIDGNIDMYLKSEGIYGFTGSVSNAVGCTTGYITGQDIKQESHYVNSLSQTLYRSLIKFDIDFISQSIDDGDIISPTFILRIKTIEAKKLPISYTIYAFPVSQSWINGDGYWSDGGSDKGVSWNWRDMSSGSSWYVPHINTPIPDNIDYLENYGSATESFSRGGATWYNIPCTQSVDYSTSDINIDVTPIVNAWLSNQIPNEGFILMYSGETQNDDLYDARICYFSKDTNTIFQPKLDVGWDDSTWNTGSIYTGSVNITTLPAGLSGSMYGWSGSAWGDIVITGVHVRGGFSGNAGVIFSASDETVIESGSIIDAKGNSGTINNLPVLGFFSGTSSLEDSGSRYISGSLYTGIFYGSELTGIYGYGKFLQDQCPCCYLDFIKSGRNPESFITGSLSGSYHSNFFNGKAIVGTAPSDPNEMSIAYQYSYASGGLVGTVISGSLHGGIFVGMATSGILTGARVYIPFTGSYSYLTSSYSFTSSVEITSSALQPLNTSKPHVVIIQNLKKEYSFGDFPRIGVFAREQFPLKTFGKASQQLAYITPKYLPTSSYYSIKDNETEETIIDFDNYTRISCDDSGNYFYLDTTGLEQERYYRIRVKVDGVEGNSLVFDSNDLFKIRR